MNDTSTALLDAPETIESDVRTSAPRKPDADGFAEPNWLRRGHIPGLDGVRAIAVLLILATHAFQTVGFPDWPLVKAIAHQGVIGVDVFFALSGFLITTLIVRELERDGQLHLKRFYIRRAFRIMPAYVSLLAVVAILQWTGYLHLTARDWIGATTYTTNFYYHPSWELGHSWSLSIEEHFYLIWPFVLYAGGVTWGWRVGLAWVFGCWFIRCAIAFGLSKYVFPADYWLADTLWCAPMSETWTFTRLDTISMGSLLALACRSAVNRAWLDRITKPGLLWAYFATLCLSIFLSQSGKFTLCAAYTLNGICITLLMWGMIQSHGVMRRFLGNPVLTTIGLGSYSIYLWQQLFIHPHHAGWIHEFPQNVAFALCAAFLSFWLIEWPMNQLKARVAD